MTQDKLKYHCPAHPDRPPFCAIGDYTPCRECYLKFRNAARPSSAVIILVLLFSLSCFVFAADPNVPAMTLDQFPFAHWLEQVGTYTRLAEPNDLVVGNKTYSMVNINKQDGFRNNFRIAVTEPNRIDLEKFAWFARHYAGDPNYKPPVEVAWQPRNKYYYCSKAAVCKSSLGISAHLPYPQCPATKGYKMTRINPDDLFDYRPCPDCMPEAAELQAMIDDPNTPDELVRTLKELMY